MKKIIEIKRIKCKSWSAIIYNVVVVLLCGLVTTDGSADDIRRGLRPLSAPNAISSVDWDAYWGDEKLVDPVSRQGQGARGLYFNSVVMRRIGAEGVIKAVRNARLDAAVIDLKDSEGRILYQTKIGILQRLYKPYLRNAPEFVRRLRDAGVYTIGRIVCFSDPKVPRAYPDRAVLDARPRKKGKLWATWGGRNTWLDPYNGLNHDVVVQLAVEAEALGVNEIQLDYIRFPVDEATSFASFPAENDTPRRIVLLRLLRRIDQAIGIPIGVDVFGLTALRRDDRAGLGQSLEDWARYVEVFTPMLYLNGMSVWAKGAKHQRAMRLVTAAVTQLRRRLGHGPVIRPFLQAFPQGADYYTPEFIDEQIRGARQGGADGFLFWHPGSNYVMVREGMNGPAHSIGPFSFDERYDWRVQAWSDGMSPVSRAVYFREMDRRR
ncbi:MAG: hypothetical protein JXA30_19660 [Deltaproteobacteria bacterium]|nr:hypothetical protein [Deltaproteobacteria bacterium]